MILRLTLPIAELLVVAMVAGLIMIIACIWQITAPGDGPPAFGTSQLRVEGNRLYDNEGRYHADWIPGKNGEPGYWKSVPPSN